MKMTFFKQACAINIYNTSNLASTNAHFKFVIIFGGISVDAEWPEKKEKKEN